MATFASSTITNAGAAIIAGAVAGGLLTITQVTIGSGTGVSNPATQTALVNQQMVLLNPTLVNNNAGQVTVNVALNYQSAPTTVFSLTELGVWGTLNGGSETLIAYLIAQSPYDPVQQGNQIDNIQVPIAINGVPAISLAVTGTGVVLNSATVLAGTGITVTPTINTDGVTTAYTVAANVITGNVTLYVSTSGNDSTAKPNNSSFPWATIQGAVSFLSTYNILPGFTATIQLEAGNWPVSTPILVSHPQGQQITIQGTTVGPYTLTAGSSTSSTSMTVTMASTSGISVGDNILIIGGASIANGAGLGLFPCTAVTSTTVTVTIPTHFTLSSGGLTGATLLSLKSVISVPSSGTNNCLETGNTSSTEPFSGSGTCPGGTGVNLSEVAFVGPGTGAGVAVFVGPGAQLNASYVGARNFLTTSGGNATFFGGGFQGYMNGSLILNNCAVTNCNFGIEVWNGMGLFANNIACNWCIGTGSNGGISVSASDAILNTAFLYYNQFGMQAGNNADIQAQNMTISNSGGNALDADQGCSINFTGSSSATGSSGAYDIVITNLSSVIKGGGSFTYGNCNVATGFTSITGCYFNP